MKLKLILAALLICFTSTSSFAKQLKIATVDIQKVFKDSKRGSKFQNNMAMFNQQINQQIAMQEQKFQQQVAAAKQQASSQQPNLMSGSAPTTQGQVDPATQQALQKTYMTIQQNKQSAKAQLQKLQEVEIDLIKKVTAKIAKKKKYDFVVEAQLKNSLLYISVKMKDITKAVTKAYDKLKDKETLTLKPQPKK